MRTDVGAVVGAKASQKLAELEKMKKNTAKIVIKIKIEIKN